MGKSEIFGYAPKSIAPFLRESCRGSVLMANSAGVYLEIAGQILLLHDSKWGIVPNGISLADYTREIRLLAPATGDAVYCEKGGLHFAAGWIKIAQTKESAPYVGKRLDAANYCAGLESLGSRETGLAPLVRQPEGNPLCALAYPRIKNLCRSFRERDAAALGEAVKSLLGLGPGLTPSADDVLCGLLYGLLHSPMEGSAGVKMLQDSVCTYAPGLTHPVSAAYLKGIARGQTFSRLENAWRFLTGQGENCLKDLLEIGSSSGGDLLLGLLIAGNLLEMEERKDG